MKTATKTQKKTNLKYAKVSLNELSLKLFNKALKSNDNLDFEHVARVAVKLGYLVHPDVCNAEVLAWLNKQERNFNSTFYKSWNDVISKSRFELFIDQLLHYASTYGTDFTGTPYLPEGEVSVPEFSKFKVILPITQEEVIIRAEGFLTSGIALKQETIEDVLGIFEHLGHTMQDVDRVKNKEVKMFLCKETNTVPKDAVEMVRFLVYLATNKTLLIKDRTTLEAIKVSNTDINFYVDKFGAEKLSSVFLRFKPLFLSFRSFKKNKALINRLRKLAVKNHVPMEAGYFETLLANPSGFADLQKNLAKVNNFKKVRLLQTILVRSKELENRAFVVRNQKLYIKEGKVKADKAYFKLLFDVIYKDLVASVSKKKCVVNLPTGVNLTLPISEKSFIGNYPLGTSFDFSDSDNIVGINWRGEDGADDLDLSLIDVDGKKYGWNAAYKNDENSILYSGDMTSANPEATELFYASKGFRPAIVKVNGFRSGEKAKFKFFVAKEKLKKTSNNNGYWGRSGNVSHMVNPNNIIVNVDCEMDSTEKCLGVITDTKFVLAQFRTGRGRVSYNSVTDLYTNYTLATLDCYISLEKLLTDAGFTFSDTNPDIDFNELSKDTLMNILG